MSTPSNEYQRWSPRWQIWLFLAAFIVVSCIVAWQGTTAPKARPEAPAARPLEPRTKLVKTLDQEKIEDTINKLPNFDDTVWVMGSMGNYFFYPPQSYTYSVLYYPRLNRVRKILAYGREDPARVVPLLKEKLDKAVPGFGEIEKEVYRILETSSPTLKEPDEYHKRMTVAPAAAYLLAELGAEDALPLMAKIYATKEEVPVSRVFLYYTMHLLAVDHTKEKLDPPSLKALDEYLESTKGLPVPTVIQMPSWNAAFEETDFRIQILHRDIGLAKEPSLRMRMYPAAFTDFEKSSPRAQPTAELNRLFDKLDRFIKLAYR